MAVCENVNHEHDSTVGPCPQCGAPWHAFTGSIITALVTATAASNTPAPDDDAA